MLNGQFLIVPHEYWVRIARRPPLCDKIYLVIDEVFGAITARYTRENLWKGICGPDPDNITHYLEFEYPR